MVKTFIITGNTWSSRNDLKNLGGRWVPHLNAWLVPDTEHESVARLRTETGFNVRLVALPIEIRKGLGGAITPLLPCDCQQS